MNSKRFRRWLLQLTLVLFVSLLPGILLSLELFISAAIHDRSIQSSKDKLPSTDLSGVRIRGYALG